jgi:hypothetical protein
MPRGGPLTALFRFCTKRTIQSYRRSGGAGISKSIAAISARYGSCLRPMSHYRMDGRINPPELVLGFGDLHSEAIKAGISKIGDLLRQSAAGRRARLSSRREGGL